MTEEELRQFLRQELMEIGDTLMSYYDFCRIEGNTCKAGDPNPCCVHTIYGEGLCQYMYDGMCHNPNVDCRLWICKTAVSSSDPVGVKSLMLLEEFGKLYGLVRSPLTGHPYTGADRQPR